MGKENNEIKKAYDELLKTKINVGNILKHCFTSIPQYPMITGYLKFGTIYQRKNEINYL